MKIKDFCDIRIGHAFRTRLTDEPNGNVRVIQPKNVSSDGALVFKNGNPLRTNVTNPRPLLAEDVLVVSRGRFAAAVFDPPGDGEYIVPSSILVLSVRNGSALPEYVAMYINSANGQKLFRRHLEKTTVPYINTVNMANMDLPVPPMRKQRMLVDLEGTTREYARLLDRKTKLLRRIIRHELEKAERSTGPNHGRMK